MLLTKIKKRLSEGDEKKSFWLYIFAEFVFVILGILIALQIDNWNQERQERKLERVLLSEMLVNLQSDLRDANFNYNYHEDFSRSNEIVLSYLDGQIPYSDSLEYHFGHLNGGTVFNENISAYESLKSIGIDLIRTDSLRQKITYLYTARYNYIRSIQDMALQFTLSQLYQSVADHLYVEVPFESAHPLDPAGIREINSFRQAIINNIVMMNYQRYSYRTAIALMQEIINEIELELE